MKVKSVLFVCTGNTCRSPIAEALLRHMLPDEKIDIFSRGLSAWPGAPMTEGAREALRKAGVTPHPHRAERLMPKDIERAERIYVMTQEHLANVLAQFPAAKEKTKLLLNEDVVDPVGGSPSEYEKCRMHIQEGLLDLITEFKS